MRLLEGRYVFNAYLMEERLEPLVTGTLQSELNLFSGLENLSYQEIPEHGNPR